MNHVLEPERRRAARLVTQDSQGRTLLFQYALASGERFWVTPGGGLERHETFEEAAFREAREELGLDLTPSEPLWECSADFWFGDRYVRQQERYFRVQTEAWEPTPEVRREHAHEGILETRWWTIAEIEQSKEPIYPEDLSAKLKALGPPD